MKRYALFQGTIYYPGGGWSDFAGTFDTIEEALAKVKNPNDEYEWYEIIDLFSGEDVTPP